MDFYRKTMIKKPRKQYRCHLCLRPIEGEHYYIAGKWDDFWSGREHIDCNRAAESMCSRCDDSHGCMMDIGECFRQEYSSFRFEHITPDNPQKLVAKWTAGEEFIKGVAPHDEAL